MKRNKLLHNETDTDPMGVVANLFDVAMVFAVALMVALVTRFNMTELFSKEDFPLSKIRAKRTWKLSRKKARPSIGTRLLNNRRNPARKGAKSESPMNWKTVKSSMSRNSLLSDNPFTARYE